MRQSKYIWQLKESKVKYSINGRIIKQCKSYNNTTKRCSLCAHEKFIIISQPELCSLNSRSELLSKCRHRNKFLLIKQYTLLNIICICNLYVI